MLGVVKWFKEANEFGFIRPDEPIEGTESGDVFFHRKGQVDPESIIKQGDRVSFSLTEGERGLKAVDIQIINGGEVAREYGVVKWFKSDKGYGFIVADDRDDDVFVHHSAIEAEPGEFRVLNQGERVSFEVVEGGKGLQAVGVRRGKR